mgnify:CR=1 FL=1
MTTYVLYHANCYDGFGAAWVARKALPEAILLPVSYGQPPPPLPDHARVYLLDFSYPRAILEKMKIQHENLYVIDHHHTAQEDLKDLEYAYFDLKHSAVILTWRYFCAPLPTPLLLEYIEDRDLWKFMLPYSEEVHAWLSSYPREFDVWDGLMKDFHIDSCCSAGAAIVRFKKQKLEEMCSHASQHTLGGYVDIPHVNVPYNFGSEAAHLLLTKFPSAPFVAYWFKNAEGQCVYGLRSRKDFDCSKVAKRFGGGGHPQASGFII